MAPVLSSKAAIGKVMRRCSGEPRPFQCRRSEMATSPPTDKLIDSAAAKPKSILRHDWQPKLLVWLYPVRQRNHPPGQSKRHIGLEGHQLPGKSCHLNALAQIGTNLASHLVSV